MARVLPAIEEIVGYHAKQSVYPPHPACEGCRMQDTWQRYFWRWEEMTLERINRRLLELVPSLSAIGAAGGGHHFGMVQGLQRLAPANGSMRFGGRRCIGGRGEKHRLGANL